MTVVEKYIVHFKHLQSYSTELITLLLINWNFLTTKCNREKKN